MVNSLIILGAENMKVTVSSVLIQGARIGKNNALPYFSEPPKHLTTAYVGFTPDKGFENEPQGFSVLPYSMQDSYKRAKRQLSVTTITIENNKLAATFLPECGGRLCSLYSKTQERELLYVNPVLQPCNHALRNAWISGGAEWNAGNHPHSPLTLEPVFFAVCGEKGSRFLRMYEYERKSRVYIQIDFHLPKDSEQLYIHTTLHNSPDSKTQTAFRSSFQLGLRRFCRLITHSDDIIIETRSQNAHKLQKFGVCSDGKDFSVLPLFSERTEAHIPKPEGTGFIAACYDDGFTVYTQTAGKLRYGSVSAWGTGENGRHIQSRLTKAGNQGYFTAEFGVTPARNSTLPLKSGEKISFLHAVGCTKCDTGADYSALKQEVTKKIERECGKRLAGLEEKYRQAAALPADSIIHQGTGWGTLESFRRRGAIPKSLLFPVEAAGEEQYPFVQLLKGGIMPKFRGGMPASHMTDPGWLALMEQKLAQLPTGELYYHCGIAKYENGDRAGGEEYMRRAAALINTPLTNRTLARMLDMRGEKEEALSCMRTAVTLEPANPYPPICGEYINMLSGLERYEEALDYYFSLPEDVMQYEEILKSIAKSAQKTENKPLLDTIFEYNYAKIAICDTELIDIWYDNKTAELMHQTGMDKNSAYDKVKNEFKPPHNIDFNV